MRAITYWRPLLRAFRRQGQRQVKGTCGVLYASTELVSYPHQLSLAAGLLLMQQYIFRRAHHTSNLKMIIVSLPFPAHRQRPLHQQH